MAYDWDYFRHKYVTGDVTLEHLASLPNSPALGTLKRRSTTEEWAEQRRHYRDQTATKAREVASTTEAEVAARHARIARALQGKALERLKSMQVSELAPRDVLAYMKEATAIEREALGLDRGSDTPHDGLEALAYALANPVEPKQLN